MDRVLKPGLTRLLDFFIEHWPPILISVLGLTMGWFAGLAAYLKPYGLVAWGAVAILSALLLACVYWVAAAAYGRWVMTKFEVRRAGATTVNPLEGHYSKKQLRLADFFHPFFRPTSAAKFQDCELLGPAAIFIGGSQLSHCGFGSCEVVIIKEKTPLVGVTLFQNCIFDRCQFLRVTFSCPKLSI